MRRLPAVLTLLPVVVMIGGVPAFSGDSRIGPLPALASWFLLWVVLTPFFVLAADRVARAQGSIAKESR